MRSAPMLPRAGPIGKTVVVMSSVNASLGPLKLARRVRARGRPESQSEAVDRHAHQERQPLDRLTSVGVPNSMVAPRQDALLPRSAWQALAAFDHTKVWYILHTRGN